MTGGKMEGALGTKRGAVDDLADAAVKLQKTDDTCVKSLRACEVVSERLFSWVASRGA